VLTDDVLALSDHGDRFEVRPAYPRVRLWSESVLSMFGSEEALPLITPGWDKRFLDLNVPGYRFQHEPLPLAAIYFLGDRNDAPGLPSVEAVSSRVGLMALVSDTYATYLLDPPRRAREFELLGRLVTGVPLRQVSANVDFSRIPELCAAIVEDVRKIPVEA
jgi:hypothetical protein